nr:ABC transporter permease [Paenibacillus bovis]
MKQMDDLWRERIQSYLQELRRYLKYMFNDHLLFVFIFGGGAAIYYYSEWVKTLDSSFPVGYVAAIILGIVITVSPITTLLKEPDIVFLLPLETKLGNYFRKGIVLSFFGQSYILLIVLAALMPLYVRVTGNGFSTFFALLILILAMKVWNLIIHWKMMKISDKQTQTFDWLIRFICNVLLLYFIIEEASYWFTGVVLLIMIAFTIYVLEIVKTKSINWQRLIEKERGRMQMFYHAANMFTDVPHLTGRVKRRKWLDPIFSRIPFDSKFTYRFLFSRTLVRTSEYSGLVVRLSIIAALILLYSNNLYFSLIISCLIIYLTGFQLIPMIKRHDLKIWPDLYPVPPQQKRTALLQLLMKVLVVQAILFSVSACIGLPFIEGIIVAIVTIIFALIFSNVYTKTRLKKLDVQ